MIWTTILYRTLFMKAKAYGTAFTMQVGDEEFLVTAKHLIDDEGDQVSLQLFKDNIWHNLELKVVGRAKGEIDVAVMQFAKHADGRKPNVKPTMDELVVGQDVYFTGFPFKMHTDVGDLMTGLPLAFAKKGMLSSFHAKPGEPRILYIDAINNEGFSGGPVFFYHQVPGEKDPELRIARTEYENVLDAAGEPTGDDRCV